MMVANNSFDLWKNDSFFSAAEEVQESTDVMESAYRLWIRERREGLKQEDLDELCRELQTALGTAKWQLEEFERAVRLSYSHRCNDNASARHRQFIAAIENQISHVEAALREYFSEEGKQPLRWINLDEEERDDLAMFLSGNSPTSSSVKDECNSSRSLVKNSHLENSHHRRDAGLNFNAICPGENSDELVVIKDAGSINKNSECVIEVKDDSPGTSNDIIYKADRGTGARRTWSSPNFSALKIVIADEGGENNKLMQCVESTPKEKGFKPVFWKQSCVEHPQARGVVNVFNQLFGGVQRQRQNPVLLPFNRSVRLMLVLMLTVFLIVPFVLYST
ncbi:uncharacterized protein LOC116130200 [Pistacia vera]|uniref:uncharacterized protein LOC116113506 n=1 Tax=Pistacia vera TaxID=55513 RepID=UPI001262E5B2|nr:uncharacterized protein LOC116113506 [Pistacia vera]XP_031271800.1 uncharacterized protein LOC116130200 [Pistacia vera]